MLGWRLVARAIEEVSILAWQFSCLLVAALLGGLSTIARSDLRDDAERLAVAVVVAAYLTSAAYEVCSTRVGGLAKVLCGLQLTGRNGGRPSWRQAVARWLVAGSLQPLVWLWLVLGGSTGEDLLVMGLFGASLTWRALLVCTVVATKGQSGLHDRIVGTSVARVARVARRAG